MSSQVRYTIRCDNCDRAMGKEESLIAHVVVHHGYTVERANREVPKQIVEAMERVKQQLEEESTGEESSETDTT